MTNLSVIENKISVIKKYLQILQRYRNYRVEEICNDDTLRGAVERYLYLVSQATIDLAEAIIAYKKFRKPSIYSETFEILKEERVISFELAEKLVKMAGFRNVIAHMYEIVDFKVVYDVLQNRLSDIEEFLKQVQEKV